MFARVYSAESRSEQLPLMYFNRKYHGLGPIGPGVPADEIRRTMPVDGN
jgi:hypothetical protein